MMDDVYSQLCTPWPCRYVVVFVQASELRCWEKKTTVNRLRSVAVPNWFLIFSSQNCQHWTLVIHLILTLKEKKYSCWKSHLVVRSHIFHFAIDGYDDHNQTNDLFHHVWSLDKSLNVDENAIDCCQVSHSAQSQNEFSSNTYMSLLKHCLNISYFTA